jgi:DNA processing protein
LGRTLHLPLAEPDANFPHDDAPDNAVRTRVVSLLGVTPVSVDELIRLSGASPALVRMTLLELDLAGRLDRQPGGMVAMVEKGG